MKFFLFVFLVGIVGCTEPRVKKYSSLLEPRVGTAKKEEIDKLLGSPTWCKEYEGLKKCEYRSSRAENAPVPDVFRKQEGMGPDLSPYDRYDVLHLTFDNFGIMKEWEPVVMSH